jgi:hypothetical protein
VLIVKLFLNCIAVPEWLQVPVPVNIKLVVPLTNIPLVLLFKVKFPDIFIVFVFKVGCVVVLGIMLKLTILRLFGNVVIPCATSISPVGLNVLAPTEKLNVPVCENVT